MSQSTLTYRTETRGGGQPLHGNPRSRRVAARAARLGASHPRIVAPAFLDLPSTQPNTAADTPLARYVVQVVPSREDAAARRVMALSGDAVRACFPLRRQMPRKTAGEWGIATDLLFPGYLFLASDDPEAVAHVLRRSTQPDLMLSADGALAVLTDAEAALVHALGGAEGVVRVSRGAIEGGRLAVASGPLAGLEGLVCHVDRHRRAAWLDPSRADEVLLGRAPGAAAGTLALPADARGLKVGLEVVSKS